MTKSIFTNKYQRFRRLLIAARKKAGLTQAQLALKIGQPQSFVSKYELGERRLDVIEFLEVTAALEADAARMLRDIASEKNRISKHENQSR